MSLRIVLLLKKQPNSSQEEFSEYWEKTYGEIFTNLKAVREKVVKYDQFHVLRQPSEQLKALGLPVSPYDGAAEFYVNKVEDILHVFTDKDYQEIGIPEEKKFLQRDDWAIMVGEDKTFSTQ